jgi:hypothetical protein
VGVGAPDGPPEGSHVIGSVTVGALEGASEVVGSLEMDGIALGWADTDGAIEIEGAALGELETVGGNETEGAVLGLAEGMGAAEKVDHVVGAGVGTIPVGAGVGSIPVGAGVGTVPVGAGVGTLAAVGSVVGASDGVVEGTFMDMDIDMSIHGKSSVSTLCTEREQG